MPGRDIKYSSRCLPNSPGRCTEIMKDIYKILDGIGVKYEKHEHPAVFTVEEAEKYAVEGVAQSKNLFLRNKKGDKHFLVVTEASKKVDLKVLGQLTGVNNLSFASPERLMKYLGLTPGSVSPFGMINDEKGEVQVIIDSSLLKHEIQGFHPNINTATVIISTEDFIRYLNSLGNKVTYLGL